MAIMDLKIKFTKALKVETRSPSPQFHSLNLTQISLVIIRKLWRL